MVECTLRDSSCVFYAVFFNMPYLKKSLKTGSDYVLYGRMSIRHGARVWTNPEFSIAGGERDVRGILPVYRHSAGLTDINLRKWISEALKSVSDDDDWIGADIIEDRRLCGQGFAYRNIHFPASEKHYKAARYRQHRTCSCKQTYQGLRLHCKGVIDYDSAWTLRTKRCG
jgi:ATP-dependent DNA helicase RecG